MIRLNLKDIIFYAILIALAYYIGSRLLRVREGFESPVGFCTTSAAVDNCRCDDFHPCKNGFTCQNGLCRVPAEPEL